MDKIELIKQFLKHKGLTWNGKIIDNDKEVVAVDADFNINNYCILPITIPEIGFNKTLEIVVRVDLISFISYGISLDMDIPPCFVVIDEFKDILERNDLSKEWRQISINNKGLVYKMAAEKYIEEQKIIASNNCKNVTLNYLQEIKKEKQIRNEIHNYLDSVKEDINENYESLNK